MVITYKYRIKSGSSELDRQSRSINYVWNYCNETSNFAWKRDKKWLHWRDFCYLTAGSSKELGVNAQSIQEVCKAYYTSREKACKSKIRWRSKKSLGWIPIANQRLNFKDGRLKFMGTTYNLWYSRLIEGKIKKGCFTQDAKGHWYVCFNCEVDETKHIHEKESVGIDLGLKTTATLSDGNKTENPRFYKNQEEKLKKLQRAKKKKQVLNLHTKIRNQRKDFLHKATTKIANKYRTIVIGDVSAKMLQSKYGKSSADSSIAQFKTFLAYKASRLQGNVQIVNEKSTTITCSECFAKSGPSGLGGLVIREWKCTKCGSVHDRDINSAINILRLGHQPPVGEPNLEMSKLLQTNKRDKYAT